MDKRKTIEEEEKSFIQDLNTLDDWFLQYEYLLEISSDISRIPDSDRKPEYIIKGCQSAVWVIMKCIDGHLKLKIDSEALIVRGILSIFVYLLDGRPIDEILLYKPQFIEATNIKKQISTDRFNGVNSVYKTILDFARAQIK